MFFILALSRVLSPVLMFYGVPSPQEAIDYEEAEGLQEDKGELGCIMLQQFYKV